MPFKFLRIIWPSSPLFCSSVSPSTVFFFSPEIPPERIESENRTINSSIGPFSKTITLRNKQLHDFSLSGYYIRSYRRCDHKVFVMKPEAVERPPHVLRWTPASPGKLICCINYSKHLPPGVCYSIPDIQNNSNSTVHYNFAECALKCTGVHWPPQDLMSNGGVNHRGRSVPEKVCAKIDRDRGFVLAETTVCFLSMWTTRSCFEPFPGGEEPLIQYVEAKTDKRWC